MQSSLPFSVRILYREPYRSKKRTVFKFFTKSADRTESKNVHFSVFTIKITVHEPYFGTVRFAIKIENGKSFCFCYGTVRTFFAIKRKTVLFLLRKAVKKIKIKFCLNFNGTVHAFE